MKTQFFAKNKVLVIVLCILLALIVGAVSASAVVLNQKNIYGGVYVDSLNLGGMAKDEAATLLAEHYAKSLEGSVLLSSGDSQQEISLPELLAGFNAEELTEEAFKVGREGNPFRRLKTIFSLKKSPARLAPVITCDEALLADSIRQVSAGIVSTGEETKTELLGAELIVTRGIPGQGIDIEKAVTRFRETALTLAGKPFTLTAENIDPKEPTGQELYEAFHTQAKDAEYKVENRRLSIVPEVVGVDFDPENAQSILNQTTDRVVKIPVTLTQPEQTAAQIDNRMFGELLGTYSSRYNAGDTSRSHNVRLASQNISEVVLAPGDVFSYNDVVGPRTVARGFKSANVYVGNKVEPGIGGGICQVSSTLYNAVVLSDLKIVTRTNHSLPVSYVPMGRDATVSYGSIDFKFENSTQNPIKIVASASGGINKISIYGTKDHPGRTIEITTECISTRPCTVIKKEDPTLPEGTVKVEQAGASGSSYNAYKITKENGSVVKREFLAKSTYVPSDRIEIVGTMPLPSATPEPATPSPIPTDAPTTSPTPAPTVPTVLPPNASETATPTEVPAP